MREIILRDEVTVLGTFKLDDSGDKDAVEDNEPWRMPFMIELENSTGWRSISMPVT